MLLIATEPLAGCEIADLAGAYAPDTASAIAPANANPAGTVQNNASAFLVVVE